jgi:hypothetical protein
MELLMLPLPQYATTVNTAQRVLLTRFLVSQVSTKTLNNKIIVSHARMVTTVLLNTLSFQATHRDTLVILVTSATTLH